MKNKKKNRISAPTFPARTVHTCSSRHVHVSLSHLFFLFLCTTETSSFSFAHFLSRLELSFVSNKRRWHLSLMY